ncbi:MAG TPA: HAMP domain-containing sensor histidine kinase [candidate division Zixibacteria bacterium]|nr:HAMP domain-containing sensor histidine kinase [candidate division Zixibacteria bacterium]
MSDRSKIGRRIDRLYIGKSTIFKAFLLVGIVVISAVFIWYTFDLIDKIKEDTRAQVEKYVRLWQMAATSPDTGAELPFVFDEIIVKANFPIIVLDAEGNPVHWRNIRSVDDTDTTETTLAQLKEVSREMLERNGAFPLYFDNRLVNTFCYGDSEVVVQLQRMPFVEIGIVVAFLIVGLIGFQNIRKSEERHIWVGMAKETAHQLGTPITSLMGWLEVLESECGVGGPSEQLPIINETAVNMKTDIRRLQKIANRFGMIGSRPETEPHDLNELLTDTVEYYRRRLPFEGKGKQIIFEPKPLGQVSFNPELLGWAFENLVKNALQSVDSKTGRVEIKTELIPSREQVLISITDNGKGISPAAARKIFRAGFTTKKRGWGLGLTLVKRIVEEYHGGRVELRKSHPGETIFDINLPLHGSELQEDAISRTNVKDNQ